MTTPKGGVGITSGGEAAETFIGTEQFSFASMGLTSGISGNTLSVDIQVVKVAWGSTAEFFWTDKQTTSGITGCGSGPLPVQIIDRNGADIATTTISGSNAKALDVHIRGQGTYINVSNNNAGSGTGTYIAVAGTTNGGYVPIAGSTVGGAIPHIGATTDIWLTPAGSGTAGFQGTISSKLRSAAESLYLIKHGGTGSDGTHYPRGISTDIRSFLGSTGYVNVILTSSAVGLTANITSIAGGVTIGIGSVAIDNPVKMGSRTAGATFEQLIGTSTTLKTGVRLKNINGSSTLTVAYDSAAGVTTGMTSGYELSSTEELFLEVSDMNTVYVMGGLTAGLSFCYYAS